MSKKTYTILKNGKFIQSASPGKYAGYNGPNYDKVFGRLDCKSGMRMRKEYRVFFLSWEDAIEQGFRPCKNCKPKPFTKTCS